MHPLARPLSAAVAIVIAAVLALAPARAFAAEDAEAEALISRGIELREQGKDDEALAVFRAALARSPTPRARAQVALAEQALGLWVAAEGHLAAALAEGSDPWIAKNRAALEGALGVIGRRLGSLEVRGTEGARVYLDGVELGALPASSPFRVEAGTRRLELRLAGFHASARAVEVPAGGIARETVVLVPLPEENTTGGTPGRASSVADGSSQVGSGQRTLGWVLGGLGVAMLGAGTGAFLVREGEKADYNADPTCPGIGKPQPPDCDARLERMRTWLTVAVSSYIAGGLLVIGGGAIVLSAPSGSQPRAAASRRTLSVGCAPGFGASGAGVQCAAVF